MNLRESTNRLFSTLRIGTHTLPNRIVQGALSSGFHLGNRVSDRHLIFYEKRARTRPAMIVTESLAAHRTLPPGKRVIVTNDGDFAGLQRWAASVEQHGVRLIGQFVDPGRGRHQPGRTLTAISASALPDDLSWTVPRAVKTEEIARIVEDFAESAARLQRAGFSGVELSCGHGHLLHQFLSPQTNDRQDAYGGDAENRTRFIREITAAIRAVCGVDFIIGLKIPGDDGVPGGVSGIVAREIVSWMAERAQADYFAIAQGSHHPRSLDAHIPDYTYPPLPFEAVTRALRQAAGRVPVLAVGGIRTPEQAEHLLMSEAADAVMLARALLADPEWVAKAMEGRGSRIRPCISCNGCWEETWEQRSLCCVMNPAAGRIAEINTPVRVKAKKEVAVVGGGPAGLEAATMAARRGHRVTLYSSSAELGGGLRLHALIPGCEQLGLGLQHKILEAREAGVRFHVGEAATLPTIQTMKADAVILANGARSHSPLPDMSVRPGFADLRSFLRQHLGASRSDRYDQLLVYDQDHTVGTYDAIRYLSGRGVEVTVVTPREAVAQDVNLATRLRIFRELSQLGVQTIPFTRLVADPNEGVGLENIFTGRRSAVSRDIAVVYSTPRIPAIALRDDLARSGIPFLLAGDVLAPSTLMHAVRSGHAAGLEV